MQKRLTDAGKIPKNPLDMPPPYWRSSGIIFQLTSSLEDLCNPLKSLLDVHPEVDGLISDYFDRNPNPDGNDAKFGEICEPLWEVESKIELKCELAVFMAAIEAEDLLNRIIVYNLHKDISESIEKLSPPEKLLVISANLTGKSIKNCRPYQAIRSLSTWRNSYAHGHCTDRPTKSLRHNHLIKPEEYPSVPKEIEQMIHMLKGYLEISKYLRSISHNSYTKGGSVHDSEIETYLEKIQRYHLTYEEDGQVYDLKYE